MIARGMFHLAQSAAGGEISEYHLQAAISACHCAAQDYASTDWPQILSLYDRLMEFDASPVVALNRAVAVAEVRGAQAGIEAVNAIENPESLADYYLFHAVLGEFESQLNHWSAAAVHFRKALELAEIKSGRAFLKKDWGLASRFWRRRCERNCRKMSHECPERAGAFVVLLKG